MREGGFQEEVNMHRQPDQNSLHTPDQVSVKLAQFDRGRERRLLCLTLRLYAPRMQLKYYAIHLESSGAHPHTCKNCRSPDESHHDP